MDQRRPARERGSILQAIRGRYTRLRDRLPVACVLCGERSRGGLCLYCRAAVCRSMDDGRPRCSRCALSLEDASCPDCRTLTPAFAGVIAAFDYAWPGDLLIRRLKLEGRYACAPVLARLLAERCDRLPERRPLMVAPVPASRRSLALRGFNPAGEVGRELARRLQLQWRPKVLKRIRDGTMQKGLKGEDRRREVEGLYACTPDVAGCQLLVVDDVMTTGSTLDAIARAALEHGATAVWGAVLARTP